MLACPNEYCYCARSSSIPEAITTDTAAVDSVDFELPDVVGASTGCVDVDRGGDENAVGGKIFTGDAVGASRGPAGGSVVAVEGIFGFGVVVTGASVSLPPTGCCVVVVVVVVTGEGVVGVAIGAATTGVIVRSMIIAGAGVVAAEHSSLHQASGGSSALRHAVLRNICVATTSSGTLLLQLHKSWSKDSAPKNMRYMVVRLGPKFHAAKF